MTPPAPAPPPDDTRAALAAAFDGALRQVDRALADGLRTADGEPAAPRLTQLRETIVAERAAALDRGQVETGWVRTTVRDVAAWTRESEVALLAALGGIARAGGRAYGEQAGDDVADAGGNGAHQDA